MEGQSSNKTPFWIFIGVLALIIFIWSTSQYVIAGWWTGIDKQGQFGDSFGAVNALFSGLAFAGLIYTMLLQREDLKLQRIDLEETRKELQGQKV